MGGKLHTKQPLPFRASFYIRIASLYMIYDKMPWELGYPHYEEFDNIMPFIIGQVFKKRKRDEDIARDYENQKREMAGIR